MFLPPCNCWIITNTARRIASIFFIIIFFLGSFTGYAQSTLLPYMPPVGSLVAISSAKYDLPYLVGMRFKGDDLFKFTFVINRGNTPAQEKDLRIQAEQINKYFLAALTIPEKDLWVNLSPYEKNRIITPELGATDLGQDLLGEDYVLK
jgi:hypothetical protein